MNRQIAIIWILLLTSVFLLTGVQGYWLYNQYTYVLNSYSEEIASKVLQAGEEEYRNRRDEKPLTQSFLIRTNRDSSAYKFRVAIGVLSPEAKVLHMDVPDTGKEGPRPVMQQIKIIDRPQLEGLPLIEMDTTLFNLEYRTGLTGDRLRDAAEKTVTNRITPFNPAQFDSILVAVLPGLEYRTEEWPELPGDSAVAAQSWKREGSLFEPCLAVPYAYSPLENKGVTVSIRLPVQSVLYRMGVQLVVSIGLILLLIVCLIFQLKTILKQRKINEIRESFVNTMVHELKRPVQTLKTFVSFLKDKEMRSDEETAGRIVHDSMFELDNLSAYLSKLKDMLSIDSEATSLFPKRFSLNDLIGRVVRLTHIPDGKAVNISTVYEGENLHIEADPIHLANVLSNLIENAIKYSDDAVDITIRTGRGKNKIRIAVEDNGIGIPAAEQERIFAKFYRGSNIPDKEIPGIGLGLSYVKLIVEAHQGNIHLESQPGKGTTITLYLPQSQ